MSTRGSPRSGLAGLSRRRPCEPGRMMFVVSRTGSPELRPERTDLSTPPRSMAMLTEACVAGPLRLASGEPARPGTGCAGARARGGRLPPEGVHGKRRGNPLGRATGGSRAAVHRRAVSGTPGKPAVPSVGGALNVARGTPARQPGSHGRLRERPAKAGRAARGRSRVKRRRFSRFRRSGRRLVRRTG
jgi:hypothetical protein